MYARLVRHIALGFIGTVILSAPAVMAAAYTDEDHAQSALVLGTASNRPTRLYAGGQRLLSFSLEYQDQTRTIIPSGAQGEMPEIGVQRLTGLMAVDVMPWLTLEGGAGMTDVDLEDDDADRERDWEWRVGGRLRLIDYRLTTEQPYYFGIEGESFYRTSQSENWYSKLEWNELYAALLFSLSTHPLIHFGDDVRIVTLYGGPAMSLIDGEWTDDWGTIKFHEDQNMGATVGLSFMPDEFMTIKLEAQYFDELSVGAGVAVHF